MSDRKQFFDNDPIIQRLRLGKARIEKGWCQDEYQKLGGYCTLGAIGYCDAGYIDRVGKKAAHHLQAALPPNEVFVWAYNDTPGRAQSDIIALFDRAIALRMAELTEQVT